MCTVTVVPHERGSRLICNRDERRTRPPALAPVMYELDGRQAVFPLDPQGGSTWIGINDVGLAVALLNLHGMASATGDQPKRSRGLVVRELLQCTSLSHAREVVDALHPCAFASFLVVIVHLGRIVVARSETQCRIQHTQRTLDGPLLFTSSSLGDALVEPQRRRLFERMVLRSRTGWLDGQARFHHHQWRRRPEISVRMKRADALTVSRTTIDVANGKRHLLYEAPLNAVPDRVRECCSWH
jgi:hypothetical protein